MSNDEWGKVAGSDCAEKIVAIFPNLFPDVRFHKDRKIDNEAY